jgi:hypothetical protein
MATFAFVDDVKHPSTLLDVHERPAATRGAASCHAGVWSDHRTLRQHSVPGAQFVGSFLIDGHVDFRFVREQLKDFYSSTGRPSIDPEVLLRLLLGRHTRCRPRRRKWSAAGWPLVRADRA